MKRIIAYIISILTAFFLAAPLVNAQIIPAEEELLVQKADSILAESIELKEHVGVTAGIYVNGKELWSKGAGWRDEAAGLPAKANMVHRIASISKPMTAIAVLQLYEQGKIDLDAPIQKYIPEYPQKEKGSFTVRQLLTHTSGTAHYKSGTDGFSLKNFPSLNDAMKRFWERDLIGKPGEVYQYSTYGYVVLGVVIERLSGMEYEAYMKKYVWGPIGMTNTYIERKGREIANTSALYKRTDKGELKKDLKTNISMKIPGGGIISTASDLLKFGEAILENKLIKPETFELMITNPGIRKGGNPYGMGWFLYKDETDRRGRIIGHSGSQAGCSSQLMILLDKKVVVAVIGNTRKSYNDLWMMTWEFLNRAASSKDLNKPLRKIVSANAVDMDKILGTYDFGRGQIMKITRKGDQLYTKMNKNSPMKLYPESQQIFYYRGIEAEFSFEYAEDGSLTKSTYWQFGQEIPVKKIE